MQFEIVNTTAQPMLYVTRSSSMNSEEIGGVMGDAFAAIGEFINRSGVAPAGPPLAVYRDWDGSTMKVDVGFPVAPDSAVSSEPEVRSGQTPAGKALKAVHRGSYMRLRETYEAMEVHIAQEGLTAGEIAWEVYVSDPDQTSEEDLLTEIYMRVNGA
ncbi:GyrI-like domain-containing protein [Hoyosella sp. YIM 151337]|uniref:GyrI-like domain-containing protein n=1 Tax=Hoyosella sp. YIM 151337 TaxID=2992742 RepID=UPI002236264A|nr:GyrI-like domain-containing protein [Hoyosella sp. YIM 151337]MCW4353274.1 GyrI-like domain-containing protein [Hoyosella sp. YIM 151337]